MTPDFALNLLGAALVLPPLIVLPAYRLGQWSPLRFDPNARHVAGRPKPPAAPRMKPGPWTAAACCRFPQGSLLPAPHFHPPSHRSRSACAFCSAICRCCRLLTFIRLLTSIPSGGLLPEGLRPARSRLRLPSKRQQAAAVQGPFTPKLPNPAKPEPTLPTPA
jgi:hypothetical protein